MLATSLALAVALLLASPALAGDVSPSGSGSGACPTDGSGPTPPATCTLCHLWFDTDLDTNGNFVTCVGSNTWRAVDTKGAAGGGGDTSSNTASSVAGEHVEFADTTGKLVRRSTFTGVPLFTSGVPVANTPLGALSAITPAADRLPYYTGASAAAVTPLTAFIRTLLDDNDATAARTTMSAQVANAFLDTIIGGANPTNYVQAAGAASPGYVTTGAQSFAGVKTFVDPLIPPKFTVATLPSAAGADDRVVVVTDSLNGTCTTGGGSIVVWCRDVGGSWAHIGNNSGGGGGSSTLCGLNDVACGTPQDGFIPQWDAINSRFTVGNSGVYHLPSSTTAKIVNEGDTLCGGGACNPLSNGGWWISPLDGWVLNERGSAQGTGRIEGGPGHENLVYVNALNNSVGIDKVPTGYGFEVGLEAAFDHHVWAIEGVRAPVEVYTHTQSGSPHTITATECRGGIITNLGATGATTYNLPSALTERLVCTFQALADQTITVNPSGTERILILTNAAGDSITSPATAGSMVTLYSPAAGQWAPLGRDGTWTDTN